MRGSRMILAMVMGSALCLCARPGPAQEVDRDDWPHRAGEHLLQRDYPPLRYDGGGPHSVLERWPAAMAWYTPAPGTTPDVGTPGETHVYIVPSYGAAADEICHNALGMVHVMVRDVVNRGGGEYVLVAIRGEETPWGRICVGRSYGRGRYDTGGADIDIGWANADLSLWVFIRTKVYGYYDEFAPLPEVVQAYLQEIPSTLPSGSVEWSDWCQAEVDLCLASLRRGTHWPQPGGPTDQIYQITGDARLRNLPAPDTDENRRVRDEMLRSFEDWWARNRATIDFEQTAFRRGHGRPPGGQGPQGQGPPGQGRR